MADDDVRKNSSSGGVFTLLAKKILSQGGLVCGAAFDENFRLSHVMIDSESKLDPLRKSRYIQSNIDLVYRRIKNELDNGKTVLFTGTPCQVAGVRSYLGGSYENFYAVDIFCHGVPSEMAFRKYVEETSVRHTGKPSALKALQFRKKDFGWSCSTISNFLEFAWE